MCMNVHVCMTMSVCICTYVALATQSVRPYEASYCFAQLP